MISCGADTNIGPKPPMALQHDTASTSSFGLRFDDDAITAIAREKELKNWRRDWKIRLIEEENPGWVDLYPGISNWTFAVMDSGLAPRSAPRNDER
jgi:hypothetical protein